MGQCGVADFRRRAPGLVPLAVLSGAVVLTVFGLARGLWLENVHNALLAVTFTGVGAYVLFERPRHREGLLFLATGTVHAVMFFGRQIGHFDPGEAPVWGWLGVWPLPLALALTTLSVFCFPDGRLPSRRWRPVAAVILALTALLTLLSAWWPVGYASAGVAMPHPFSSAVPGVVELLWSVLANPAFIAFQVLWVVSVGARWARRDGVARRQLVWLVAASALSAALLVVGLLIWGSPRAGILSATLLPLSAGWAIVHGQHAASYAALSWLSHESGDPRDLPDALARNIAEAFGATRVTIWLGDADAVHAVGAWPILHDDPPRSTLEALRAAGNHLQQVRRGEVPLGAIVVERVEPFSRTESRLFTDLASQAALVLDHLTLAEVIARQQRVGVHSELTDRERDVLALIARGLSNSAICDELHLSIKTVEPLVGTVFTKLGLHSDSGSNRRVLAALEYQRATGAEQ